MNGEVITSVRYTGEMNYLMSSKEFCTGNSDVKAIKLTIAIKSLFKSKNFNVE